MRLLLNILLVMSLSLGTAACGNKGKLKTPTQAKIQEEKRAKKKEKRAAEAAKEAAKTAPQETPEE